MRRKDHYQAVVAMVQTYETELSGAYPWELRDADTIITKELARRFYDLAAQIYIQGAQVRHHFTVTALVLSPDRTQCLLGFHKKCQQWIPLGGHLETTDASVSAGVLREVAEESGLGGDELQLLSPHHAIARAHEVPGGAAHHYLVDLDIHVIAPYQQEPAHEHYDLRFMVQARSMDISCSAELEQLRWLQFAEAMHVSEDPSTHRLIQKACFILERARQSGRIDST